MSDVLTPPPVRTPHRRATAIALLGVPVAALAYKALSGVWYQMAIAAPQLTVPNTLTKTGGVVANQAYTAFTLTGAGTVNGPTGPAAGLSTIAGMPTIMVSLLGAALLFVVAAALRNTIFAIGGLVVANLARISVDTMRSQVENPVYGGSYMTPSQGLSIFSLSILLMMTIGGLVAVQVLAANRMERKARRAAGEDVPSVLEQIYAFHVGAVTRAAKNATDSTDRLDSKV